MLSQSHETQKNVYIELVEKNSKKTFEKLYQTVKQLSPQQRIVGGLEGDSDVLSLLEKAHFLKLDKYAHKLLYNFLSYKEYLDIENNYLEQYQILKSKFAAQQYLKKYDYEDRERYFENLLDILSSLEKKRLFRSAFDYIDFFFNNREGQELKGYDAYHIESINYINKSEHLLKTERNTLLHIFYYYDKFGASYDIVTKNFKNIISALERDILDQWRSYWEKVDDDLIEDFYLLEKSFRDNDESAFIKAKASISKKYQQLKEKSARVGPQYNQKAADLHLAEHAPLVLRAIDEGKAETEQGVADYFNSIGKTTRRGKKFTQVAIHRLIKDAQKHNVLPDNLPFQKRAKGNSPSNE
uniref:Uncharacterized protein n=1 Tax=Roseihalotalea indica TaxID=2867963 RepID=A0AA49GJE6_9BACT|nr:hypothetical protein K4G66_18490 [Tunicatimonas sp. TK19036]